MVSCTVSDSGMSSKRRKTVKIGGEVTFESESELQREVNNALHDSDCLEIRCEGLRKADLSFVMLICAAHRTAELLKKRLIVRGSLPDRGVLHHGHGLLSREKGCLFAPPRKCRFWRYLAGAFSG